MAFATAFGALVAGNFLAEFIRILTRDDRLRAWITAVSAILGLLQIPGSVLAERYESYKKYVAYGGFFWRFWWIPIVFLPLAPESFPRLEVLTLCIVFQAISIHLVQPTYNAWLGALVPSSHRAWYFSRRVALATLVAAAIGFPFSWFVDWMRGRDLLNVALSLSFGVGVLFGFISFYFYMRMPDTKRQEVRAGSILHDFASLRRPFKDRTFRRLLVFLIVFTTSQFMAGPFFFYYAREILDIGLLELQVYGGVHAVTSILAAPLWGYLSDKYGNKPVLFLSGLLLSIGPLMWVFAIPQGGLWNYGILTFGHICAGLAWTGVSFAQFNFMLAVLRPEIREPALGVIQASNAVITGLSPMASGFWLHWATGIFGEAWSYQALFVLNGVLRAGSVFLLGSITDPSSAKIPEFLGQIAGVRPKGVFAMRRLSLEKEPERKEEAIRQIGESGMKLAEVELIKLLHDPSPNVRRQAAIAMGKVGGRESVSALVDLIQHHPHLVEEEMVEALGAIGDTEAIPALISLLKNPSSVLRRASAKALGRLGSREALEPLMEAAETSGDVELRRAAIQALRMIGDRNCEEVIMRALRDEHPSVRIAAAEACAELGLKRCADVLRESLASYRDEAAGEMAYALAHVGDTNDIPLILKVASQLESPVVRWRCLLAAARLLGVEHRFYELLMGGVVQRDNFLVNLLQSRHREVRGLRRAIGLYHMGEEKEALRHLAQNNPDKWLLALAEYAPEDGFLLAAALLERS